MQNASDAHLSNIVRCILNNCWAAGTRRPLIASTKRHKGWGVLPKDLTKRQTHLILWCQRKSVAFLYLRGPHECTYVTTHISNRNRLIDFVFFFYGFVFIPKTVSKTLVLNFLGWHLPIYWGCGNRHTYVQPVILSTTKKDLIYYNNP